MKSQNKKYVNENNGVNKADLLCSVLDFPLIERFPREFKKNWLTAFDLRFLLILLVTSIVTIGLVSYFYSHQINQQGSVTASNFHKNYVRMLVKDQPQQPLLDWKSNVKETYLYGVEQKSPKAESPKEIIKGAVLVKKSSIKLQEFSAKKKRTEKKYNASTNLSSVGLLKLLGTDSRLTENLIEEILDVESESSQKLFAALSNLNGLKINRQGTDLNNFRNVDNNYKIKGAKFEKVSLKDVITSLSPREEAKSKVIVKNVDWEEIPTDRFPSGGSKSNRKARSPEEITRIMLLHNRTIQDCYKQALKRNPELKGKIVVRFSVKPDGTVNLVNIINSSIDDNRLERCIVRRIKRWNDFGGCEPSLGDLYYRQTYVFGF